MGRARRATTTKVNYSREQEFSDDDVFEDGLNDNDHNEVITANNTPSTSKRKNRSKKSNSNGNTSSTTYDRGDSMATTASDYNTGFSSAATSAAGYEIPEKFTHFEKGYDVSLGHLRERFDFMPELELDGSSKVELIVGRRLISDKDKDDQYETAASDSPENSNDNGSTPNSDDEGGLPSPKKTRRQRGSPKKRKAEKKKKADLPAKHHLEYEYLVKYKGKSYLHLEWKVASELESLNKSAKNLYRRFLKKLQAGTDDDLEDPEFDPSYIQPQMIIDEDEHEITLELTDKELIEWEKQKALEDAEDSSDDEEEKKQETEQDRKTSLNDSNDKTKAEEGSEDAPADDEEIGEPGTLTKEQIMRILNKEGPYYPTVEGSNNPYRDGYITEPPKKPRASYLFFQGVYRSVFQKKNKGASVGEVMKQLGESWGSLSEEEQAPFIELAKEEVTEYEKQRVLLEKAERPTELWQPLRRCLMVVDRLSSDSFAEIFLEPVDLEDFPDYMEYVETAMDLGTIRTKLNNRKYMGPEQFARDMRKIWSNCKIYNQHGSAIWFVADYMSKQFERLYHAWVIEFRDKYLRWANPKARPWEQSCRESDGKCNAKDDQLVLCDHCDAVYNIACLKPPLAEVPQGVWHCVECARKIRKDPSARMLSAVSEHAARKRAEIGDIPKKKGYQKMYLVKWAGLGYEYCTWETKEDINDDALIEVFYKENNMTPDEPDLTTNDLAESLKTVKHLTKDNAGGANNIPELRCQLYSQSRALHFTKFGMTPPPKLCVECGPHTKKYSGIVDKKESKGAEASVEVRLSHMPPLLVGEYDAVVPMTSNGLLMNVGEVSGSVAFLGYRKFPDGRKGPSEVHNIIRNSGDKIIAVDGTSTIGKSFKQVIMLLKGNGKNECVHIRFLSSKYTNINNELSSMGRIGRFMATEAEKQFRRDRRQLLVKRKLELEGDDKPTAPADDEESDGSADDEESESEDEASVASFDQVSDDEDLVKRQRLQNLMSKTEESKETDAIGEDKEVPQSETKKDAADNTANGETKEESSSELSNNADKANSSSDVQDIISHQETTHSLALRLLDINVGYSSDEGGDEDCAYFLDGVDQTFSTREDVLHNIGNDSTKESNESTTIPAKRSEFDSLDARAKICSTMLLTNQTPDADEFDNYPLPPTKEMEAIKKAEEEAREKAAIEEQQNASPVKVKLSKTKIEQLSVASNEVIRVWKSAEDAAATLQISLKDIKEVLQGAYNEDLGDEVGGHRWRFAPEDAKVTKIAVVNENDKGKKAFLEFRDKLYDHEKPHNYKNGNRLRDYQIDGVNWLSSCWYKSNGCILADEMGLGKTVQIVCYIEHLNRVEKIKRPFLVVVPLSTVEHWRREFEGWSDMKTCVYHDRQRVWRDVMREYEWYYADRPHTPDFLKFDVLVTTYDTLIGDFDVIGQIPWRVTVVDEAHRLRNQKGKLLECMKEISAKGTLQHGYQSRVLMTGTPLQNNIQELWTLLNFIEPYQFPSLEEFEAHYGNMGNKDQVERLQNKISPFMLRRVKEDVAKDIPAKEETLIDVELTSIQKQYYRAIFEHNHSFLNMGNSRNVAPKLMNIQMELRKCCNHPFLLDGIEQRETEKQQKELLAAGELDDKSPEEIQTMLNVRGYIDTSGKMVLLDKLLPKLRQEGHKVLIFSQMVKMLDLLAEYCEFRNFNFERLDGRVRGNERQKAIDRFETEDDSFIFMLSTRAGGVGINLTAADICIIFDSDWNPQNDVQAQARCHRIGQTKSVMIYRLITSRTFEQEMFDRASKKLGLEQAVLGSFDKGDDGKPTAKEVEQLLKRGAYALLDEDDTAQEEFVAADIESILKKRTRTRVVEGTKTASWLNKQGMVTKSKFTADSKSASLDMEDPNFWEKVMPDFVTPSIMNTKLEELERQTFDTGGKKKGRGRGRRKKGAVPDDLPEKEEKEIEENLDDEDKPKIADETDAKKDIALSRTNQKKINKYIQDLKSMMDGVFEDIHNDSLPDEEKSTCEKLLLTISCKGKLFSDSQRNLAKSLLKRLEGDRRRKCRDTTGDEPGRFSKASRFTNDPESPSVNENLKIRSTKKRKKKRGRGAQDEDEPSGKKMRGDGKVSLDKDGYLEHSDSERDWSDVDDGYMHGNSKKKSGISKKEARRRRDWASDKDAATAAGLPWPSFPRSKVTGVLKSLLDKVIKNDNARGGVFSEPVPRKEFPEYYEMIKKPMDYGTMTAKLENDEYRSAQAMQKDFVLIMSNCVEFNSTNSDIVKEARRQVLERPTLLKEAALANKLFIAEDGNVIDVYSDVEDDVGQNGEKIPKKRGRKPKSSPAATKKKKGTLVRCNECDPCLKDDCGDCSSCKDKKKFGGTGELKRSCIHRECENYQVVKPRRGRPPKNKKPVVVDSDASDLENLNDESARNADANGDGKRSSPKKSRLRINIKKPEIKSSVPRIPKKRKVVEEQEESDNDSQNLSDGEIVETPETHRPKRRRRQPDSNGTRRTPDEYKGVGSTYLSISSLKKDQSKFVSSFEMSRSHFLELGPWKIPDDIPRDKFEEIAKMTIKEMGRHDKYSLFEEEVTESTAPGYFDVIKNPMDFGTMMKKVEEGKYPLKPDGITRVYEDFLLVMDNCALYNEDNDEILGEAARLLGVLPVVYAEACAKARA